MRLLRWCFRRWYVLVGALLLALVASAFLFPYLLKRAIESHSEEWIGRKVRIASIVLNPFTGVYAVNDFTCYEPGSDTVFVSFSKLGVKADLLDGWRTGAWRFREAELRNPFVNVVQTGARFNFSDLLELGAGDAASEEPAGAEVAFTVTGIALTGGRIHYTGDALAAPVRIAELDVHCTRITSGQAAMDFVVELMLESGGRLQGGFSIDTERASYAIDARLSDFALAQLRPYALEFMDCGGLEGHLDLALRLRDSYADTAGLAISGGIGLTALNLADPEGEPLLRIDRLSAVLDTLVADEQRFELGAIDLQGADACIVLLGDGADNWTKLLKLPADSSGAVDASAVSESNVFVLLAEYISYLGREFVASAYSARSLRIADCAVRFTDYAPRLPFRYVVDDIMLAAERITTENDTGRVSIGARLGGTAIARGNVAFDPRNPRNLRVMLTLDDLRLAALDPYARWYAAHPMEEGALHFASRTVVDQGRLDSRNTLRIDQLRFGKRVVEHDTGVVVLPLRLAAGLLKDAKGVVELNLPVSGDLNDPRFRAWPIVWQVLKNLVVKAVTAPGRALVRAFSGADESDAEGVRFEHAQGALLNPQRKALTLLAKILKSKPELSVSLIPLVDGQAEQEEIALFEAKRMHLFGDAPISGPDSARIARLAHGDSLFLRFLELRAPQAAGRSLQERCIAAVGVEQVARMQAEAEYARREGSMQYLLAQGAEPERLAFREAGEQEVRGMLGRPGYRFIYEANGPPTP